MRPLVTLVATVAVLGAIWAALYVLERAVHGPVGYSSAILCLLAAGILVVVSLQLWLLVDIRKKLNPSEAGFGESHEYSTHCPNDRAGRWS